MIINKYINAHIKQATTKIPRSHHFEFTFTLYSPDLKKMEDRFEQDPRSFLFG